MEFARLIGLAVALAGLACVSCANISSSHSRHATTCPITLVPGGGLYGNDALDATLWPDGKFIFKPGGPGFVDFDGALGIKFAWDRKKKGPLFVGGRRLDGSAGPARAYISDGYGDSGFQPIYLVFPTPGCWEITGAVADASLTFVVLVKKIGEGPSWRFEGLPRGWRVTSSSSGS